MVTSITLIFKFKLKLGYIFCSKLGPENLVQRKENADTMKFWQGINEEPLEVLASESKSFPLFFFFNSEKEDLYDMGRGRSHQHPNLLSLYTPAG